MAVVLFNLAHLETKNASKVEDFQQRKQHLKNAVCILDHVKNSLNTEIEGYNIDLSQDGLDFFKHYTQAWMFINAYEQIKPQ